jgi:hypothetical protein
MEKPQEHIHDTNTKATTISKKVIQLINTTLKNPWDHFSERINYIIQKAIISSTKQQNNILDNECQKRIFEEVCIFLNELFKEVQIKKFYNNIPDIDLVQYWEKNIGEQFVNNIYGKDRKLFYREELKWGSCHHWTILLKNLFDILKEKWVIIENRILAYDTIWWHSALLIRFQWEKYLADINDSSKKIISSVTELNKKHETKEFSKLSFNKKHEDWKYYFDSTREFAEYIKKRPSKWATIEFKPKFENGEENDIRLELWKGYIALIINGEIQKYRVNTFSLEYHWSEYEVIESLLKNIHGSKDQKQEISKYLYMIVNKIDPQKILEIYK